MSLLELARMCTIDYLVPTHIEKDLSTTFAWEKGALKPKATAKRLPIRQSLCSSTLVVNLFLPHFTHPSLTHLHLEHSLGTFTSFSIGIIYKKATAAAAATRTCEKCEFEGKEVWIAPSLFPDGPNVNMSDVNVYYAMNGLSAGNAGPMFLARQTTSKCSARP